MVKYQTVHHFASGCLVCGWTGPPADTQNQAWAESQAHICHRQSETMADYQASGGWPDCEKLELWNGVLHFQGGPYTDADLARARRAFVGWQVELWPGTDGAVMTVGPPEPDDDNPLAS